VSQIRLQPVVVQNVTTYGTVIDVPNQQLKLKPGMTANVKVEIAKRTDVLRVPNAALRFRPNADIFAALNQPVPPEALGGGRGGRGQGGRGGAAAPPSTAASTSTPAGAAASPTSPAQAADAKPGTAAAPTASARQTGGADTADRQARLMDRFKTMSPDEQKQFIARMKDRGQDASAFEKAAPAAAPPSLSAMMKPKYGAAQPAQTIDALFAPLLTVESRGRAWLFMDHQLKPVNVRLGITDGTNTELLSTELTQSTEVVTGVTGLGATRATGATATGNPLMPQRGGAPGRGR
jgi:HlyD family secretion protein